MTTYWKVHIRNFDIFVNYLMNEYDEFVNELYHFKNYYEYSQYLYLFVDKFDDYPYTKYKMTFVENDMIGQWKKDDRNNINVKYMGEFNPRKEKLKKLNGISEKL